MRLATSLIATVPGIAHPTAARAVFWKKDCSVGTLFIDLEASRPFSRASAAWLVAMVRLNLSVAGAKEVGDGDRGSHYFDGQPVESTAERTLTIGAAVLQEIKEDNRGTTASLESCAALLPGRILP